MKPLPVTAELLVAARRVMWLEEPEHSLAEPVQFLAHVMVFGGVEHLKVLRGIDRASKIPGGASSNASRNSSLPTLGLLTSALRSATRTTVAGGALPPSEPAPP
jgi:hypothetical protein